MFNNELSVTFIRGGSIIILICVSAGENIYYDYEKDTNIVNYRNCNAHEYHK